jgi:hypothetical protein
MAADAHAPCYTLALEAITAGYFAYDTSKENYGMFSRSYSRLQSNAVRSADFDQRQTTKEPSLAAVFSSKSVKQKNLKRTATTIEDAKNGTIKNRKVPLRSVTTVKQLFSSRFSSLPQSR